jgi:NDP-sugar pyrophosphorylase family protein
MEPEVISYIPEKKRVDMDWLLAEIAKTHKISVYPIYKGWFDIGQWELYRQNSKKIEEREDV